MFLHCLNHQDPGPVKDLSSVYPVILWQPPDRPNGVIKDYELNFTRDRQTNTFTTFQAYFITETETIPGTSGPFIVEVKNIKKLHIISSSTQYNLCECIWS